jgi:hypothetical protein
MTQVLILFHRLNEDKSVLSLSFYDVGLEEG